MNSIRNKTILITGGTDGIGRELVLKYLQAGANVVTCGRNQAKILDLEAEAPKGSNLCVLNADVSVEKDCQRLVESVVNMYGGIDILINNAGISMRGLLEEGSRTMIPVIRKVMEVNFNGTLYCTSFSLPHLIKSKGIIVGVSSIAGYRGLPGRSGYSASKFAVQGFLEAIKTEVVDKGVHVMWVSPGFTASRIRFSALDKEGNLQGATPMDEQKMMSAARCADLIIAGIADKKRTVVMTFQGKQTVFLNKFFPKLTDWLVRLFYFRNGTLVK
jgi:NAD(P)-dependent dehydrogenase (short-subunit alcohol dehydrogenase family)